jgi:probable HAF family extracellular repeat protein
MKSRVVLFLCATLAVVGTALAAQQSPAPHYAVMDLGTLPGGTFSQPFVINDNGVVSGSSTLADNNQNAVLWDRGRIVNLGTLGGPNSIAFAVNNFGLAGGEAEVSTSDPNGEDFCGFGTHLICLPVLWQRGGAYPLPTLGGNNGGVNRINGWGTAVGVAETAIEDPACPAPQKLQFRPAAWQFGKAIALPTEGSDPDGLAMGINDSGQVVGGSGICTAFNPNLLINLQSVHALLWQNGRLVDLGNLGGQTGQALGNLAFAINNRAQVVGVSDLAGDTTYHAFLWTATTRMQDLGTLPGDVASLAISINDLGVVVGLSIAADGNTRAVVWHGGVPTDLNTLVQPNSPLYLLTSCSINSGGEITGLGITSSGEVHAYRAIPL